MSQTLSQSRKMGVILLFFLICFSFLLVTQVVLAADPDPKADTYGLDSSAKAADLSPKEVNFPSKIGSIVGILLSFVGVLFFILIIYAGVMWMTAAGNEQQVSKAKDIIIAAVIGLVIVLSAYAITNFVGTNLSV